MRAASMHEFIALGRVGEAPGMRIADKKPAGRLTLVIYIVSAMVYGL